MASLTKTGTVSGRKPVVICLPTALPASDYGWVRLLALVCDLGQVTAKHWLSNSITANGMLLAKKWWWRAEVPPQKPWLCVYGGGEGGREEGWGSRSRVEEARRKHTWSPGNSPRFLCIRPAFPFHFSLLRLRPGLHLRTRAPAHAQRPLTSSELF
jgi:hypothetical protein